MLKNDETGRVAVIGSTSFSGSSMIKMLLEAGYQVMGVSRSPELEPALLPHLSVQNTAYKFKQHHLVNDLAGVLRSLDRFKPCYVVNFAAQGEVRASFDYPSHHYRTNALAIVELAEALRRRHYLKKYIHISTPEVYGSCDGVVSEDQPLNPSSPYAASKASADLFLNILYQAYDFPVVTIRATNVYGPYQQLYRIIPRSIIFIRIGRKIRLDGGGMAIKSYIHINDVSRGVIAAMLNGRRGRVYHLSPDGGGILVRNVVAAVCRQLDVDLEDMVECRPESMAQDKAYVIDSSRARRELGWSPEIKFEDGISGVNEWIDHYWDDIKRLPLDYEFRS